MGNERKVVPNTALGIPEERFRALWVARNWKQMLQTGKGFRRPKQPTAAERRKDEEYQRKLAEQQKTAQPA